MSPLSGPRARPPPLIPPASRPPCGRPAVRTRLHVLTGSGMHPSCHCGRFVSRPQPVCVNRATGITALSPFRVPESRLPQPLSRRISVTTPLHPPHPAVSLRSRSATASTCRRPRPQPHRAISKNQHLPFSLRIHSGRTEKKECAGAHLFYSPPCGDGPQGPAALLLARRAARARGSACKKKAGEVPGPPFMRARFEPPHSEAVRVRRGLTVILYANRAPGKSPAVCALPATLRAAGGLHPSAAWPAQAGHRWGRPCHVAWQRATDSAEGLSIWMSTTLRRTGGRCAAWPKREARRRTSASLFT
jgi:hypothetical protein